MRRVTLMTLGSPGLRAVKSLAFSLLRGLTRPGRSRTKQADEDLHQESSDREAEPVRGKP